MTHALMQATLTTKVQVVPARHVTAPSFIPYVLLLVVCITVLLYLS